MQVTQPEEECKSESAGASLRLTQPHTLNKSKVPIINYSH